MTGSWLKRSVCCLVWLSASWTLAAEPVVVLERPDFVRVLQEIDYLRQDRANLDQQLEVAIKHATALKAQLADQAALIEQLEAQIKTDQEREAVLEADRTRLHGELARRTFWSDAKDYGLVGLGVVALILAVL